MISDRLLRSPKNGFVGCLSAQELVPMADTLILTGQSVYLTAPGRGDYAVSLIE